jgi:hypothetical protein
MPSRTRRPTDPEIETYLEIEADEPPESGLDAELESELALNIAFSGDLADDGRPRVTETVTETSAHTLTLTVPEPVRDHPPMRTRAITAQDAASVSGTISIPDDSSPPPTRRAKRQSDGWEE